MAYTDLRLIHQPIAPIPPLKTARMAGRATRAVSAQCDQADRVSSLVSAQSSLHRCSGLEPLAGLKTEHPDPTHQMKQHISWTGPQRAPTCTYTHRPPVTDHAAPNLQRGNENSP
eukprot:1669767-Rhodomonas_salina.1